MNIEQMKPIIEAAILVAGEPVTVERLRELFAELPKTEQPSLKDIRAVLAEIATDCEQKPLQLQELASGFCFQAKSELGAWLKNLWPEKPPRYTRALLETLAIIAYRQPVTRAEIEDIRGVAVSTNMIKTLLDHEWIRVVGQREVPGRPSLYGTTKEFLDHFNLKSIEELPALAEVQNLEEAAAQLENIVTLPHPTPDATEASQPEAESIAV